MASPKIFFIVGDHSGDIHAASLIREIRRLSPEAKIYGFGGPRMAEAGCELHYDLTTLSMMWLHRFLHNLRRFCSLQREALNDFDADPPDAVVLVDYPGFNLFLARWMRKRPTPAIYYFPPQIWAWFTHRVYKIRSRIQKVLTVLPFENHYYERTGVPVEYVGHPLFDHLRRAQPDQEFLSRIQSGNRPLVGLLPGSRKQEVESLLPAMLKASKKLEERIGNVRFVIAPGPTIHPEMISRIQHRFRTDYETFQSKTYEIMAASDACLAASGTTTLELAHFGVPMVVLYRVNPLAYIIGRFAMRTEHIALINVIAGREVVPEMLLYRDNPSGITSRLERLLRDTSYRERVAEEIRRVVALADYPGASLRAARAILGTIEDFKTGRRVKRLKGRMPKALKRTLAARTKASEEEKRKG